MCVHLKIALVHNKLLLDLFETNQSYIVHAYCHVYIIQLYIYYIIKIYIIFETRFFLMVTFGNGVEIVCGSTVKSLIISLVMIYL